MTDIFHLELKLKNTILILILLSILLLIGIIVKDKVEELLNSSLEDNVALQAKDLSILADERFERELISLRLAAEYLQPYNVAQRRKFFEIRERDLVPGFSIGILDLKGNSIYGQNYTAQDFPRLPMAYRGRDVVDYNPKIGLIFITPIFSKGNIESITYRLYANFLLINIFNF
ncbi:MAG: hypothetical protein IJU40_06590, partial [Desulfovibrionaceae bacterium]|nr:hypothetical protein [Desulfovibrionaceae bacterium]